MIKTPEQFAATNKAAVDTLLSVATASLANAERLAALNLNTARSFFADAADNVGSLLAVKDVQGLIALQKTLAKPALEKTAAYSKSLYEILDDSAKGFSQIFEGQTAELKKNVAETIEQSLKNAPAGSESVVAAVKSALAQAESVYESMAQSSKQAKSTIENTVAAANAAAMKLISGVAA